MSPFVRRGDIIIWPWGQRSRSHEGHYSMRHTTLWSCTHILEWYYLKNNYLTSRSKVKVPRRSLRYATHRLMVIHPHTKYQWPTSKDKNVMARTRKYYLKNNYLTLRSKVKVHRRSLRDTPPYGNAPTYQISFTYLERQKSYGLEKLRWEEAEEAEEKITLNNMSPFVRRGDINIQYKYKIQL